MDLMDIYEIDRTVDFILRRNFTRVALQFPDELLKDCTKVVRGLREKIGKLKEQAGVGLFVMADSTYGSCCVDEVGASHINADCVIHYGHTCLSPTSTLPAFFVFGKAMIDVSSCASSISNYASNNSKPFLVLFGLEYAHAIPNIREELVAEASTLSGSKAKTVFHFAEVMCPLINPPDCHKDSGGLLRSVGDGKVSDEPGVAARSRHSIGGLSWELPSGQKMEDYLLLWIGSDNSAFANVVLTFNGCEIVRYDANGNCLGTDFSQQRRILKRRYYLVEKAKDANIVGILVGTLGVAGYLNMIHQMKELIAGAGKKVYTLVMGRPNPAKLANFPECDVFIYVSCAQTALLDSKEFYAPVITPFEAMLAFNRGSEWTGAYVMEFRDLINSSPVEVKSYSEEARFSLVQGRYVEDFDLQEFHGCIHSTSYMLSDLTNIFELLHKQRIKVEENEGVLALANATEKALQLQDRSSNSLTKGTVQSGADYFATRSYHGLDMHGDNSMPEPYLIGRTGKASGYQHEEGK
ncbi:2-(3-AMINO-3-CARBOXYPROPYL)HISTIDINE SYNTHASE SUBUNIT 2 [Salix purpurea]|uniref:2-(3-AMINO-3-CARBOXYPROPYL)HISTIDINE SYNTHASE SUBUNIT 2 n=1 Tax=Salix purpurea TaxID=77065 RepID=A0A9Q0Q3Q3_SALPP|nr:2-(3-AMINO-3-CARBOXYPROPYL)HISTIDINE SYNTHASE SUBUNIT 2 [Salix purpurea]